MKKILHTVYNKLPASWRKSNKIPLLWHSIKSISKFNLPLTIYRGESAADYSPFSFAYAGNEDARLAYWLKKIFPKGCQSKYIGTYIYSRIPDQLKQHHPQCHFVIMELNNTSRAYYASKAGFNIPYWMYMGIDISPSMEELVRMSKSGFYDIKRRIKKNSLKYEICHSWENFQHFYQTMHKPFIHDRHEQAAVFNDTAQIKSIFERSDFFIIKNQDTEVGGGLIEYNDDSTVLRIVGIKDGDRLYLKQGVLGAVYYFSIQELKKKNINMLNVGGTPPFFCDGLTQFKMRLLSQIIPPDSRVPEEFFRLIPLKDTSSLRFFLSENPFMFYSDKNTPKQAVFITANTCRSKKDFHQKLKYSKCKGLEETEVYIPEDMPEIISWLDDLMLPNLNYKPFKSIFWTNGEF